MTMFSKPIALRGAPGSPYTRKMLAVLRYRRIPYRFLVGLWSKDENLPAPKVDLLPTFYFETDDGDVEAVVDSTPIIRRLESEVLGRSVIPTDPAVAFISSCWRTTPTNGSPSPCFTTAGTIGRISTWLAKSCHAGVT